MPSVAVVALAVAAVLLFWTVGAYNRLVGLRNQIVALFAPLDEQFRQRHQLLRQQAQALAAGMDPAPPGLEPLHAALSQADAACAHARAHPGAAGAIASLRLAEEVLAATRARLPVPTGDEPTLADLRARLAAGEVALDFARRRFNDAVAEYNGAVRQFPTLLIAAMFEFRAAATL